MASLPSSAGGVALSAEQSSASRVEDGEGDDASSMKSSKHQQQGGAIAAEGGGGGGKRKGDRSYYRVRCQDNGCGMAHDRIPDMLGRVLSGSKYGVRQTR